MVPDAPLEPLCPQEGAVSLLSNRGTSGDAERAVGKFLPAPVRVGKLLSAEMAEIQQVFMCGFSPQPSPSQSPPSPPDDAPELLRPHQDAPAPRATQELKLVTTPKPQKHPSFVLLIPQCFHFPTPPTKTVQCFNIWYLGPFIRGFCRVPVRAGGGRGNNKSRLPPHRGLFQ